MAMFNNQKGRKAPGKEHAKAPARAPRPRTVDLASEPLHEELIAGEDVIAPDSKRARETFLPITFAAIADRLTRPQAWAPGQARAANRLFQYLAYWRKQQYQKRTLGISQTYEPFNPDSDNLQTRQFTDIEKYKMQKRLVNHVETLLTQANYVRISPSDVETIMTAETHYGLDFTVDLDAFEELLIFYRGASTRRDQKRDLRKFYRKVEFDVPVYQRLLILFKMKPRLQCIEEEMRRSKITRKQATKIIDRKRRRLPEGLGEDNIYMKLFRDIPRADLEMIFPNTEVRFRTFDKIKMGVTGIGGLGVGIASAAGKVGAVVAQPLLAIPIIGSIGGIAFRQVMGAFNQHQKYMVVMAQNLYFHALADNLGVLVLLADRAAEEDVKEEVLLYSVLCKETVNRRDLDAVDRAIEKFLHTTFGIDVDFDLEDALGRLLEDGLVTEAADGTLQALPPTEAAERIDQMWDLFLDNLPDVFQQEGTEFVGRSGGARHGPRADGGNGAGMSEAAQ
ncbi:MAG: TMEM143 family protein [Pseudomonadota bacterium]